MTELEAYHELCGYTLALGDPAFIHQHVVDAFAAQTADEQTKPIKLTFALIGLHLHVDRLFTGKEVQRAHQHLARAKRAWPSFGLPSERGTIRAAEVLNAPAGSERDDLIHAWCAAVWSPFRDEGDTARVVASLCADLPHLSRAHP